MQRRRRSSAVNLALLGAAGGLAATVGGCSSERPAATSTFHRNVYASVSDCAADYSQGVCAAEGYRTASRFLGPTYAKPKPCSSNDPGPGPAWNSRRTGVDNVERGGFGTTACSSGGIGG